MKDVVNSIDVSLNPIISYHLGWQDENGIPTNNTKADHTLGLACLLTCISLGGDPQKALPASVSVEMIRGFCEIHDDVQNGMPKRSGKNAVWWIWGPAQAINVGDGMHALSRLALFRLQFNDTSAEIISQAAQLLDKATIQLCDGRFKELEHQERIDITVEDYINMASSKTGALLSCSMQLGALLASVKEKQLKALDLCGKNIGIVLQIKKDLTHIWETQDDDFGKDNVVLNKNKLLPIAYALETADVHLKRQIGDIYFKRVLDPNDVLRIRDLLDSIGVKQQCESIANQYMNQAKEAIFNSGIQPKGNKLLSELVDFLLNS